MQKFSRKSFLALLVGSSLTACIPKRDYSISDKEAEKFFPALGDISLVNGLKFHNYGSDFNGDNVIFIHGANINLRDWVLANENVKNTEYNSIYVDRPGFGYSERDSTVWTAKMQAEQIRAFAQKNKIKKPVLVAHSWGSLVALEWLLSYPQEVRGFVSVAGVNSSFGRFTELMSQVGIFDFTVEIYSQNLAKNASNGSIERFAKRVFLPLNVPNDYLANVGADLSRRRKTILANNEDLKQTASTVAKLEKRYSEIDIPVEIIHGKNDWLLNANIHGQGFANKLTKKNLTILEGVGHMAHHSAANCVRDAVHRILEKKEL